MYISLIKMSIKVLAHAIDISHLALKCAYLQCIQHRQTIRIAPTIYSDFHMRVEYKC
jgi:hypothetical protein